MSTDHRLEDQLADYFTWLEAHLGTTMSGPALGGARPPSSHTRHRRRWMMAGAVASMLVAAGVGITLRDHTANTSLGPAESAPAASNSADGSTGTASPPSSTTADEALGEPTWAPVNLAAGWQLLDAWRYIELSGGFATPYTAQSLRYTDGFGTDARFDLAIEPSQPSERVLVAQTTIHSQPAQLDYVYGDDDDEFVGVWFEAGYRIEVSGSGLPPDTVAAVLDGLRWRAEDPGLGAEPDEQSGLSLLGEEVANVAPRLLHGFVVRSPTGHLIVAHVNTGWHPRMLDLADNGSLMMDDGTWVQLSGLGQQDGPPADVPPEELRQATASFALVTGPEFEQLAADASRHIALLPDVRTVAVGSHTVRLKGGTATDPEAVCIETDVRSPPCWPIWLSVEGIGLHAFALDADDGWFVLLWGAQSGPALCAVDPDAGLGTVLEVPRLTSEDEQWALQEVPPGTNVVSLCNPEDPMVMGGLLRPGTSWPLTGSS